jgi:hypothetical protein
MSVDVVLPEVNADRMLAIVRELKTQGLAVDRDFSFRYVPAHYDNDGWSQVTPKQCVFTFREDKQATMFMLKYGQ